MKITLAFLLLGICALTNAFILPSQQMKQMSHTQAFSQARMLGFVWRRYSDLQECHRCTHAERLCIERAMVEDIVVIVKIATNDLGCSASQLLLAAKFEFHHSHFITLIETLNFEAFIKVVRGCPGGWTHFVQTFCAIFVPHTKKAGVDCLNVWGALVDILPGLKGIINGIGYGTLNIFQGAVNAATGLAGNVVDATGDLAGDVADVAGGVAGGLVDAASGLVSGTLNAVDEVAKNLGGVTKMLSGITKIG